MKSKLAVAFLVAWAGSAQATPLVQYVAPADPGSEGFGAVFCCGTPGTQSPVTNDDGLPAWVMSPGSQADQSSWHSGGLSTADKAAMNADGFTVTLTARVLLGNAAPYGTVTNGPLPNGIEIAGGGLDTGVVRWEIGLGLNVAGDVVAVPMTGVEPGVYMYGTPYVLPFSASNGWNTYQLLVAPGEASASFWIDGVEVATGYTGNPDYITNAGLGFGALSGGEGDFNLVSVSLGDAVVGSGVPEPSTWAMMLLGFAGLGYGGFRARRPAVAAAL